MRYSEIIIENRRNVEITSMEQLERIFSNYNEVRLPKYGWLVISASAGHTFQTIGKSNLHTSQILFPPNFTVYGNMVFKGIDFNASGDLTVTGNLELKGLDIKSFPEKLKVGGYLDLSKSSAISGLKLPNNLEIGNHLDLSKAWIDTLPSGLKIGGDLNIEGTQIQALPRDIQIKGYVTHDWENDEHEIL